MNVRVTGTTDLAEIAAVIAAISAARGGEAAMPSAYEQWRQRRTDALRASRGR